MAFVGHSQGATVLLASLTLIPDCRNSISIAVSLAGTGGSFSNVSPVMKLLTSQNFVSFLEFFRIYNILGTRSVFLSKLFTAFPLIGHLIMRGNFDYTINNDDIASLPYYELLITGGTSTKNLKFIGGLFRDDKQVVMPDYGPEKNLKLSKTQNTTVIDYSNIQVNLAIFGGKYDKIITQADVEHLHSQLPKEKVVFYKPDFNIDHSGFCLSKNDEHIVKMIQVLKTYY